MTLKIVGPFLEIDRLGLGQGLAHKLLRLALELQGRLALQPDDQGDPGIGLQPGVFARRGEGIENQREVFARGDSHESGFRRTGRGKEGP